MNAPARIDALPRFGTIEKAIATMKPGEPVYCIFPEKFAVAARRFLDAFPGDPLYAIKANPAPHVLDQVWAARHPSFRHRFGARDRDRQDPLPPTRIAISCRRCARWAPPRRRSSNMT